MSDSKAFELILNLLTTNETRGGPMDSSELAAFGKKAVEVGTPDFGKNGDDIMGVKTDGSDTIVNVLHHIYNEAKDLSEELGLAYGAEALALSALDSARTDFEAEIRGED